MRLPKMHVIIPGALTLVDPSILVSPYGIIAHRQRLRIRRSDARRLARGYAGRGHRVPQVAGSRQGVLFFVISRN